MNTSFSTIDEYISSFPAEQQTKLNELRQLVKSCAPDETTETITYKMPTFRYNGNLFHFAQYKNHIGLYPGSAAIEHFANELAAYKTSKGAIQISIDSPLPTDLIRQIITFNIEQLKDKQGPNWHKHREDWTECIEIMNQIMAKTNLVKEFKWGSDIYTFEGKNVIGWGGFKNFFSLWFYNGVFLIDKYNVLISASEGKTKALRQWRFTNAAEMDEQKIYEYILESIQTIKDGKEIKVEKSPTKEPIGLLKNSLDEDELFNIAFQKLTPGKRKEYIEYIEEAKQEKTQISRLDKIKPMILEGKGLNDKYKR